MGIPVLVELTAVRANEARKVLAVLEAKVLRMPESKFYGQVQPLSKVPLILKGGYISTVPQSKEQGSIKITYLKEKGKYSLLSWNYFIIQPH